MRQYLWALLALFTFDRFVKDQIWFTLPRTERGFLLYPVLNKNIAFSLTIPEALVSLTIPILIIITLVLMVIALRLYYRHDMHFFWWALIAIGALSNVLDRLTLGGVLDYIDFRFWPVFNVSDSYIFIGVCALVIGEFFSKKNKPHARET